MLSIGKPPSDLFCACDEVTPTPLNSDERASPSPKAQLPDLDTNFSIRNYVFAARSKDVRTNWPFSQRNLQLCLNHGVTDPLPPFQSLDSVRNHSFPRIPVKTISSLKQEISRSNKHVKPSTLNNDDDYIISNDGLANDKFPTGSPQLESESVLTNRQSNNNLVSIQPDTLLSTSVEKEVVGPTVSRKTEAAVPRLGGKKGRMVVKLGGNIERSSTEDIASTSTAVSETMASKVCPVCKTFSSSSNTTLNAHIDQCLSEEPTPKWSAGSKLVRHRIKPRKTRLMVDIYETALPCTLEDLDRRNGSNWAIETCLPSKDTVGEAVKEERQRVAPVNSNADVDTVYIDSSGTKLRILSKSSDCKPSSSTLNEDPGPRRCFKDKISKVLMSKKKRKKRKQNAEKPDKSLKLLSRSNSFRSQDRRVREDIDNAHVRASRSQVTLQSSDNGTLKKWSCSKRSGPAKQLMGNDRPTPLKSNLQFARDIPLERRHLGFATNISSDGDSSESSEDTRSCDQLRLPAFEVENPGKRKVRSPSFNGGSDNTVEEPNFLPIKRRKSRASDVFQPTGGCAFHGSINRSFSPIARGKSSRRSGMSPSNAVGFSRMEKKVPSAGFLRRSKFVEEKRVSAHERSEVHLSREISEPDLDTDEMTDTASLTGSFTEGFGQDNSALHDQGRCSSDEGKNTESSSSLSHDKLEKFDGLDSVESEGHDDGDYDIAAYPRKVAGDNDLNFSEYLSPGTPVENRISARSSADIYKGGLCDTEGSTLPDMVQENVGNVTNRDMEFDTLVRQEYEVERLMIPGPPGSFLPSPGALGSEEFQGNSSLTTSRVQSSQEQQYLIERDSSGSPVSATSTVSDSVPGGSKSKFGVPPVFAGPSSALEGKSLSGFSSDGGNVEPSVLNAASVPQPSNVWTSAERKSIEKSPYILKNNVDQPCCCKRKERIPNFQESQLLRRRNLGGSLSAIGLGEHLNRNNGVAFNHRENRVEMLQPRAPQEMDPNTTRSVSVSDTPKFSAVEAAKVSGHGEPDSITPSVSNPVLRLMGKNLMVVNKDEDALTPFGHPQSSCTPGNIPSSSQVLGMAPAIYDGPPVSSSGIGPTLGSKVTAVVEPSAAPIGMSSNWHPPPLRYDDGTYYFPNQPVRRNAIVPSSLNSRPMKEIIIIDDASEDEMTNIQANVVRMSGVSRERQAAGTSVITFPMKTTICYDPRLVSSVPLNYPAQDPYFYGQMPATRRTSTNAPVGVLWSSSPAGPGQFQQGPHASAPSSNIHIRSPMTYSPGPYK